MNDVVTFFFITGILGIFVIGTLLYVFNGMRKALPKETAKLKQNIKTISSQTQLKIDNISSTPLITHPSTMQREIIPPPAQFKTDVPPLLRAAMMEHLARKLHSEFIDNIDKIIDQIKANNPGFDNSTAMIYATKMVSQKLDPYRNTAESISELYRIDLYNAQELEKSGNLEGATLLYEKLANAGFTGSMPYERLRIIYSKQKQFEKAIQACKKYISVLEIISGFNSGYPNIQQIGSYQEHIEKLQSKITKS